MKDYLNRFDSTHIVLEILDDAFSQSSPIIYSLCWLLLLLFIFTITHLFEWSGTKPGAVIIARTSSLVPPASSHVPFSTQVTETSTLQQRNSGLNSFDLRHILYLLAGIRALQSPIGASSLQAQYLINHNTSNLRYCPSNHSTSPHRITNARWTP